jgi:hypothetical protein
VIEITQLSQINSSVPYANLLSQRFAIAGLTKLLVIETETDYLTNYGHSSPFDGFVNDSIHQVFIAIAVLNNSEATEVVIPKSLVVSELSFLQEAL